MTITLKEAQSKFEDGEDYPPAKPFKYTILSDTRKVGFIEGFKINRRAAQQTGDFHLAVEHFSEGVYEFVKALFEQRSGKLRSQFYNGRPFQRGTEAFGKELDGVDIIYIEEMAIKAEADRHQGFGTAALAELHRLLRRYPFIFIWPAFLHTYLSRSSELSENDQRDLIVAFYRKSGYRRVGNTQYFAFAQDANHPSRQLLSADDAPGEPRGRTPNEMSAAFPLHHKVVRTDLTLFETIKTIDIRQIHLGDDYGQTPLHYAADGGKLLVAMCLLERSTDELFVKNALGQTPLAAVEDRIVAVEETLKEQSPDLLRLMEQPRDKRLLRISTRPLAKVLREIMDYITNAKAQGLNAESIQEQVNMRIAPEKQAFLTRIRDPNA